MPRPKKGNQLYGFRQFNSSGENVYEPMSTADIERFSPVAVSRANGQETFIQPMYAPPKDVSTALVSCASMSAISTTCLEWSPIQKRAVNNSARLS
jgi:hypothetical protein